MVEITSLESARKWLYQQERENGFQFSFQSALGVLPAISELNAAQFDRLALPAFRCIFASQVCLRYNDISMETAALDAMELLEFRLSEEEELGFLEVEELKNSLDAAYAKSALRSIEFLGNGARDKFKSVSSFALSIEHAFYATPVRNRVVLFECMNNEAQTPPDLAKRSELLQTLRKCFQISFGQRLEKALEKPSWRFWRDWYWQTLEAHDPNWDLCREVALIPDDIWDKGPEAIAREIEEIEARFRTERDDDHPDSDPQDLADALPLAEAILFDEDAKAYAVPIHMEREDLLSRTLARVSDAVEDVLLAHNSGLHEGSYEIRVLRRAIERYANDPARIEMDFVGAHATLTQQMVSDYIPACSETLALQASLEEGARAIRATHPEVAENRALLTGQSLREMSNDEKAKIAEAAPILEGLAREDLAEEFKSDVPVLVATTDRWSNGAIRLTANASDRHAPLPEEVRFFSRAAKILIQFKKTPDLINKVATSAGFRALEILIVLQNLISMGISLL